MSQTGWSHRPVGGRADEGAPVVVIRWEVEMVVAFALISGLAVLANMVVRARGASWAALGLKTVCGLLFCAWGLVGASRLWPAGVGGPSSPALIVAATVGAGLVLGLLGDVALALKDQIARAYDALLATGMGLFALGHLAYLSALITGWQPGFPWVPIGVCLVVAIGFVVAESLLGLDFGRFKWVVAAYAVLLTMLPAMGFFTWANATAQPGAGGLAPPLIIAVAGVSFFISDLVLAWTYFGPDKNRGWQHVVCYAFYYAAQFAIAASLFWL